MGFLIFDTLETADRARDLRAKAEGFPQGETLRGQDHYREPLGERYSLEFNDSWGEDFLPTMNGEQKLTDEELVEMETILATLQPELPADWQVPPEPEEEPEPEAEPA